MSSDCKSSLSVDAMVYRCLGDSGFAKIDRFLIDYIAHDVMNFLEKVGYLDFLSGGAIDADTEGYDSKLQLADIESAVVIVLQIDYSTEIPLDPRRHVDLRKSVLQFLHRVSMVYLPHLPTLADTSIFRGLRSRVPDPTSSTGTASMMKRCRCLFGSSTSRTSIYLLPSKKHVVKLTRNMRGDVLPYSELNEIITCMAILKACRTHKGCMARGLNPLIYFDIDPGTGDMALVFPYLPIQSGDKIVAQYMSSGQNANEVAQVLCQGLHFLHKHNICHVDIKPDNIAFTTHAEDRTKLFPMFIDFGAAATNLIKKTLPEFEMDEFMKSDTESDSDHSCTDTGTESSTDVGSESPSACTPKRPTRSNGSPFVRPDTDDVFMNALSCTEEYDEDCLTLSGRPVLKAWTEEKLQGLHVQCGESPFIDPAFIRTTYSYCSPEAFLYQARFLSLFDGSDRGRCSTDFTREVDALTSCYPSSYCPFKHDVYSLGMALIGLITGLITPCGSIDTMKKVRFKNSDFMIFEDQHEMSYYAAISFDLENRWVNRLKPLLKSKVDHRMVDTIGRMITYDPFKRTSMQELLKANSIKPSH